MRLFTENSRSERGQIGCRVKTKGWKLGVGERGSLVVKEGDLGKVG